LLATHFGALLLCGDDRLEAKHKDVIGSRHRRSCDCGC
jgi:hypothetical protein